MSIRLLVLRGAPLFIRPLAIALEGLLVPGQYVLVFVLPIAMMALTTASIPVHLDYYQSRESIGSRLAKQYASGLATILLVVTLILACILLAFDTSMGAVLIAATCMMFLIEKLADESCRMLEFRKSFVQWFFVQLMRSVWLLLPIAFYLAGADYELAFLGTSLAFVLVALVVFWRVTRLALFPSVSSIATIRSKLIFLAASILPASYRQIPRILITRMFPEYAHIYLAIAQLAQGVALMFNVRFQIPYRKAIARKTALFQRRRHGVMMRVLLIPGLIAPIWLLGSFWISPEQLSDFGFAVVLAPLMIADALTFAILAAHMDYLQWLRREARLLPTYLTNAALLLGLLGLLQLPIVAANQTIILTASVFTLLGLAWIGVILKFSFSLRLPAK